MDLTPEALSERIVTILGEPAARDRLDATTRSEEDRAALIGRLSQGDDAAWLAELLSRSRPTPTTSRDCG